MTATRGTSNGNATGSAADRRARRAFLVQRDGWPADGDRPGLVCCYRCGVPLLQDDDPDAPGQSVTADRIVPGCSGGRYTRDNIRPCCGPCNSETGGAIGGRRAAAARPALTGHARRPGSTHGAHTHGPGREADTLPPSTHADG